VKDVIVLFIAVTEDVVNGVPVVKSFGIKYIIDDVPFIK